MTTSIPSTPKTAFLQRQKALSRWDNEGGAYSDTAQADIPTLTDVELVHLQRRVIALENLIIALLAEGSDKQFEVAQEMAAYTYQ